MHQSQLMVRILKIRELLKDVELDQVYDCKSENGVIEITMKPEIDDQTFVIGETTTIENFILLSNDLFKAYEEVSKR